MNKRDIISLFLFGLCIILVIYFIVQIRRDQAKCVADPFKYQLSKFDKAYNTKSKAVITVDKTSWIATAEGNKPMQTYSGNEFIRKDFNLTFAP